MIAVKYNCAEVFCKLLKDLIFKIICCLKLCVKKNNEYDNDYLKNELFSKGKKKLYYYTDIVTYFKKMQELDILKYIMLDDDQLKILNFVSKPLISKTKEDIYKILNINHQNNNMRLDRVEIVNLFNSYNKLNQSENIVNSKLIKLANYQIDMITEGC